MRGKKLSDEHLREVARVYNEALESRVETQAYGHVQGAVSKHFDLPKSTAVKQIMHARSRGYILTTKELRLRQRQEKLQREYDKAKETIDRLSLSLTTNRMNL